MKFTIEFEVSDLQWQTIKKFAALYTGWKWVNLIVRYEGEEKVFEADFMKQFAKQVEQINPN